MHTEGDEQSMLKTGVGLQSARVQSRSGGGTDDATRWTDVDSTATETATADSNLDFISPP